MRKSQQASVIPVASPVEESNSNSQSYALADAEPVVGPMQQYVLAEPEVPLPTFSKESAELKPAAKKISAKPMTSPAGQARASASPPGIG